MAKFRECFVRGGRAYVDSGDVCALLMRGDDFDAIAPPEAPLRLLLSGCGDSVDIYGISARQAFECSGGGAPWLDPNKFELLQVDGGYVFIHARHVVGLIMGGSSDAAPSTAKSPLHIIMRGYAKPLACWGRSAVDFLYWLQSTGREVQVQYIEAAT